MNLIEKNKLVLEPNYKFLYFKALFKNSQIVHGPGHFFFLSKYTEKKK